ncbi:MAG TPA: ABC-F family ATP-binding cassette domain-containing protein, partial [Actinomycetota bacterium]|nr:ABC-F family ATP-binding cassette domain-containing protein [Actinomycetota bacterium]
MLVVNGLAKSFGARPLFRDAELKVFARDRVALVGPNGSGKTTLFDMIAAEQQPDAGSITLTKDVVVGYLRQETDALRGRSLLEEVTSLDTLSDAAHRLAVLETEMAELEPGPERDRVVAEYGRLHDRFEAGGGYSVEHEAKRILGGLGFDTSDHARPTETFSGGWLMRIALAKLLLAGPDLLMLDEPTNHLDLESVVWLERFLRDYEGAVLLISHDRELINTLASKVVELRDYRLWSYTGDFASFVEQRELEIAQAEAAAKNQARKIAQTERFIERFRYKNTLASRVQSRIKALEKMERIEVPRSRRKQMHLRWPTPPRSGRVVVEMESLRFGYDPDRPVYEDLELVLERGEKTALVGPNGAGKSTLLKLIAGVLEPQGGGRTLGHKVELAYFAQHQIEALQPANTVLQELRTAMPAGLDVDARKLLGRFLFTGDDSDKKVAVLSGGERTRLALAKLLVAPVNLLCLDEPTNHLDMQSRDVLEEALQEYEGSIVLITHDRHLIRSVSNRIVEVVDGAVTSFNGGYEYYLDKREPREEEPERGAAPEKRTDRSAAGPKTKEQKRVEAEARAQTKKLRDTIARIEKELDDVGAEIARLEETFAAPDVYASGTDVVDLTKRYESAKKRIARLEQAWA